MKVDMKGKVRRIGVSFQVLRRRRRRKKGRCERQVRWRERVRKGETEGREKPLRELCPASEGKGEGKAAEVTC